LNLLQNIIIFRKTKMNIFEAIEPAKVLPSSVSQVMRTKVEFFNFLCTEGGIIVFFVIVFLN